MTAIGNDCEPMRWKCDRRGCFADRKLLKFDKLAPFFSGNISPTDLDGATEINGYLLIVEWKESPMPLSAGQRIAFENMTRGDTVLVIVVAGNAETMTDITHLAYVVRGEFKPWRPATFDDLERACRRWERMVRTRPLAYSNEWFEVTA